MSDYGNVYFSPSCPGTLSDSSTYNLDGSCVAGENIPFGVAVYVDSIVDGVKVVKILKEGMMPYGVSYRAPYTNICGHIEEGEPMAVVSHGRVWVQCASESAPDILSGLKLSEGGMIYDQGSIESRWTFAGGFVKFEDGYILEAQVKQSVNRPTLPEPPVVLVELVKLVTDLDSPQLNDQVVQVTADVSPSNATDKSGTWSVDKPEIATIDQSGKLTPKGGDAEGVVNIVWTANDAGKVASDLKFTFKKPDPVDSPPEA